MTYRYIITARAREGAPTIFEGVKENFLPAPNGYFTPVKIVSGASIDEVLMLLGVSEETSPQPEE